MNSTYDMITFSHEINNELTLIYSQLQLIENTHGTLSQDENWQRMKKDFSSLFHLIRQNLNISSATSAAMEPQNLISVFDEIRASWSYELSKEQIDFYIQADLSESYYVYASKTKLIQMFHNLISNSVKAIQRKKDSMTSNAVTIHLSKEQGHIVLNLSDTGIGMTKEQQKRAFYRGVSFIPDGNGVGLAVVREIADELHVKIHMDSAINQGTTFTLIFPAKEHTAKLPV